MGNLEELVAKVKDLVIGNTVHFVRVEFDEQCEEYWKLEEAGENFKFIEYFDSTIIGEEHYIPVTTSKGRLIYRVGDHEFPIPFPELKGGRFEAEFSAIYYMRWIRKSLEGK